MLILVDHMIGDHMILGQAMGTSNIISPIILKIQLLLSLQYSGFTFINFSKDTLKNCANCSMNPCTTEGVILFFLAVVILLV